MTREEIDKKRFDRLGPKVAKSMSNRGFEAYYFSNSQEAVNKIMEIIPKKSSIGWGGTVTANECGLMEQIRAGDFTLLDRDTGKSPEDRVEIMRQCLLSDFFITSFNAVSESGTVVNIDGIGNRIAAITFGPKNVIAVVGMNKIVHSDDDALLRARNVAAPRNAERFGLKTAGCAITGNCQDCHAVDSICSIVQILRSCKIPKRIKVFLIGEELGF